MARIYVTAPASERFWKKVNKNGPGGCWLWTAGLSEEGYGRFYIQRSDLPRLPDGRHAHRTVPAHRFSWELHNGPIPSNYEICHNCPAGDNRACVRPDHLFIGSQADNVADCIKKERHAHGEIHGIAKLTANEVRRIRELHVIGLTYKEIAEEFNMSIGAIGCVVTRKRWKHVL